MISTEDIKKLSDLARIEISDEEAENLRSEINPILDFVGQVKSVAGDMKDEVQVGHVRNVLREDGEATDPGTYSKELVAEFPESENGYLKVRKIL